MRKIAKRKVPEFKTEAEEREFWESHDSVDYVDWSKGEQSRFPKLKPSTESISLRLSVSMLEGLKIEANKRDVPYQSLLKMWLADKLEEVSKRSSRDGGNS